MVVQAGLLRQHHHPGGRRLATVGDGVGEGAGTAQLVGRRDAQRRVVLHLDGDAEPRIDGDRLDRQHPAERVGVVVQDVHQHRRVGGQQGEVVLGAGFRIGGRRILHVDADLAAGRVRAVGDDVGEFVGTDPGRGEQRVGLLVVRLEGFVRGRFAHLREDEGLTVGVGVVAEGTQQHPFPHVDHVMVGVGHRRQVRGSGGDLDGNRRGGLCGAVGDGEGQFPGAGPLGAQVAHRDETVLTEGDGHALVARGVDQVERVAVGVGPVGQGRVLHRRLLGHGDGVLARQLGRPVVRCGGHRHGGGVGQLLPVEGLIGERHGVRGVGG